MLRLLRSSPLAVLALSFLIAAPLVAQTTATTGAIFGVVSGTDGAPLPGVTDQAGAGGNPSVFGANLGQNSYQVDGLNTTDPVTHTFSLNFGFDAIQEIAIQTGGFEAEYGRAVGGIINVITKSGGNNFSGTADVRYTSDKLTEQGSRLRDVPAGETPTQLANDKNLRDFRTLNPEASIGGPIVRDRVWFFGDALRNMNRNQPLGAVPGLTPGL